MSPGYKPVQGIYKCLINKSLRMMVMNYTMYAGVMSNEMVLDKIL